MYKAYKDIIALHHEELISKNKDLPRLEYTNSIPILHLYGTPREMGEQYGTILKKQLKSLVELAYELFPPKKIEEYIQLGEAAKPNLPENMREEIQGMSEASGVNYSLLLALNLVPRTTCSTFAVWGNASMDGNLIMGRNADYCLKNVNKALGLIVVKHPNEGYATFNIAFLGMIGGFSGMNEMGVSYGNMIAYNGKDDKIDIGGLSIQLLMQMGAEKYSTARDMANFISEQIHLMPNNVMCADKNEAIIVECSQRESAIREGQKGVLAETNYFLSPGLYNEYKPCERYANLMFHAQKNYGQYNFDKVKEAMHIARQPGKNLQCVIFEPATKTLHVSINKVPASKGPFTTFHIDEMLMH